MTIRITSKKNGFRRCGIEHPDQTVVHPDGTFTPEQIKQLKAEPMLIVEEVPENKPGNDNPTNNPVAGLNAELAIEAINTRLLVPELQMVLNYDKRVTVTKAAQTRIDELMQQSNPPG